MGEAAGSGAGGIRRYLFDTNHAGAILRNNAVLLGRLGALTGAEVGLCIPSIGELWFMVHNSAQVAANRVRLQSLLSGFRIFAFGPDEAEEFGRIRAELRRQGRPIPAIDVRIAAVARNHGVTLLTADAHFSAVAGLHTENWLVP
jgi:tRNA(fMet)-specific endonuclease VapC